MKQIKPIDNPFGYYQVGGGIYYDNKLEALRDASKHKRNVEFIFHDDVYSKFDWTKRPLGNLTEMYRLRAQQIRDQYDYVRIDFSGGMDSWTVLHSFLANGIHVDEVFTRWPKDERKYKDANFTDKRELNVQSEFEYAVLPVLENIRKNYPRTNIVIDDFSENIQQDFSEKLLANTHQFFGPLTYFRFSRKSEFEKAAAEQGKKVAIVRGYDKILVTVADNKFYANFTDHLGGSNNDPERSMEFFFWSRDFPEIPILQAHCIKDVLLQRHSMMLDSKDITRRGVYDMACYPNWNADTFQVEKKMGTIYCESDRWMLEYNPRYIDSWRWATRQFIDAIDDMYLSRSEQANDISGSTVHGLKKFKSRPYLLGDANNIPSVLWESQGDRSGYI